MTRAAKIKLEFNNAGFRALLTSQSTLTVVEGHAQSCANAAGGGMQVKSEITPKRARASVVTATKAARKAEAIDKALTRAIRG